jgi:DNA recombination protein RmuC
MNPYISAAIGLIIGTVIAWLLAQSRSASVSGALKAKDDEVTDLRERISQMNAKIDQLNSDLKLESTKRSSAETVAKRTEELEKDVSSLRDENSTQKAKLAELSKTIAKDQEAHAERMKLLEDAKTNLTDAFKALSADALNSNKKELIESAKTVLEGYQKLSSGSLDKHKEEIDGLIKPLKEQLNKYENQITEMAKERSGQYTSLQDMVKQLMSSERNLKDETSKLVNALRAPQARGHWGEITLRRVVEHAGMSEHCDFVEQESRDSESGRLRPDMIINLPDNRKIIVDAKAPIKAFLEALEQTTEADRDRKLADHARHVRDRVKELSKKAYWDQFDEAPDFVVMFLPGEQFLGAAVLKDPDIFDDAFSQKVIIATPATLIAILKSAAYGWRQEKLAENAIQISEEGKRLYERISTFVTHLADVGKKLDGSVASYNRAIGSLETRVIVSARKMKELGATSGDDIQSIEPIDQTSRTIIPLGYSEEDSTKELPSPS